MKQYCLFQAAGHEFATPVSRVLEIAKSRPLMPVPGGPGFILGLTLLRGQVVTVWDLRACLEETAPVGEPRFDLIFASQEPFGVQVENVSDVISMGDSNLESVPPALAPMLKRVCSGFILWRGHSVLVLEPDRLVKAMMENI